jgi:pyruvate/2-oxoacid:ferredoxin oxidoreductase beta subunit
MTGGQLAPTTPTGKVATTARHGSIDPPFDACQLAIGAGATYVARGTSYHTQQLDRLIEGGINTVSAISAKDIKVYIFLLKLNLMYIQQQ